MLHLCYITLLCVYNCISIYMSWIMLLCKTLQPFHAYPQHNMWQKEWSLPQYWCFIIILFIRGDVHLSSLFHPYTQNASTTCDLQFLASLHMKYSRPLTSHSLNITTSLVCFYLYLHFNIYSLNFLLEKILKQDCELCFWKFVGFLRKL